MASNIGLLDEMLKDVDKEWAHAIELQMDYERMLNTTNSGVKIFKNNLKDLGITLGSYVMPTINEIMLIAYPAHSGIG